MKWCSIQVGLWEIRDQKCEVRRRRKILGVPWAWGGHDADGGRSNIFLTPVHTRVILWVMEICTDDL